VLRIALSGGFDVSEAFHIRPLQNASGHGSMMRGVNKNKRSI
jgi:hypothetical protein